MAAAGASASAEWKTHWPLVLAGFVGMSFYSVVTYSLGTFIAPLEAEFGWSRASISLGLTIFTVSATLGGPFVGALIDRIGTRRVAVPAIALHAVAFACLSLANGTLAQWYALWLALALVALATRSLIWSTGVSSVFTVGRSFALSVMLTGTALGQMSPLLAGWLIDTQGWRSAYLWIGLGWGGLGFVLVLLFFKDARARAGSGQTGTAPTPPGLSIAEAARDSRILRIGLANLVLTVFGSGIAVHLVPILSGTGLDRQSALTIAASAGITGIAGKLITGWLLDRVQGNLVPFSSYAFSPTGYVLLLLSDGSPLLPACAVLLMGYGSGASLQTTTYLTTRYAGLANFGKVFGMISSLMMLGTSLGPVLAGYLYDTTGSYDLLLIVGFPTVLLCACCFIGLGPYPKFPEAGRSV